MTEIFICALST